MSAKASTTAFVEKIEAGTHSSAGSVPNPEQMWECQQEQRHIVPIDEYRGNLSESFPIYGEVASLRPSGGRRTPREA